ncbi:Hypothetical predicted protein [Marmota monax]|uniref:ENTH domain-containing protein n=1 Tax=Marmota monax TaxID=9995 RepID=A0A5E4CEB4_MARMO|nr:hypothetical protein GHT09_005339 [Marmota monax]VTJ79202.1 Hypothetical predicted protein [Marmota monax]
MSEIADLPYNVVAFSEIMSMIWKRLNDQGKNWRHVYKAMTLMCCANVDRDGKGQGVNVSEKAKQLVALLREEDRLREERAHALRPRRSLHRPPRPPQQQRAPGQACSARRAVGRRSCSSSWPWP